MCAIPQLVSAPLMNLNKSNKHIKPAITTHNTFRGLSRALSRFFPTAFVETALCLLFHILSEESIIESISEIYTCLLI